MTKKLLKAFADAIADVENDCERSHMAEVIGEVCKSLNDLFDWALWNKACEVDN